MSQPAKDLLSGDEVCILRAWRDLKRRYGRRPFIIVIRQAPDAPPLVLNTSVWIDKNNGQK
jgi:hypothetical protein